MTLLLNPMGCNYSKDAPHFGFQYFPYFCIFCESLSLSLSLSLSAEITHIFIFNIQLFIYISRHSFGVLKYLIFGTPPKNHVVKKPATLVLAVFYSCLLLSLLSFYFEYILLAKNLRYVSGSSSLS